MWTPLIVMLMGLVPGVAAWWTGRRVARLVDDPALPELLMARRQRITMFVATALATVVMIGGRHAYWGIPFIATSLLVGGYPLRRKLAFESAGLVGYVWRGAKSIVGSLGFWVLLAWTPAIVLSIDARSRLVALALLPVLFLWEQWYPRIWLRLHDAVLFTDERIAPRIARVVERAGITAPALYRIGAPGTRFVNALAFPSARHPAIGMGNALLELLEPDEAAAIYAHELSHIEQFSPRVLRRNQMVNWLLIVLAVGAPLAAQALAPDSAQWVSWLWPVVVLAALVQRGRKSQKRETESDLRAAALCGDPEAVVRGLIKVHVHAFIPRRWPVDFERGASHPSLARRIQALRGEGAHAVVSLGAPTVLETAREGSVIAFDDGRAYWFDGVPPGTPPTLDDLRAQASSVRSVVWPELVELRVTTKGAERALRAMHRNGDSWSVPLAAGQVAGVQKALDLVDVRLHRELGKHPFAGVQVVAALIFFAMAFSGELGVLIVPAFLALFRPSTAAIAALGVMTVASAVFALALGEGSWIVSLPELALAALAVLGAVAVYIAWRRVRREGKRDGQRLTLALLGVVAAFMLVPLVMAAPHVPLTTLGGHPVLVPLAVTLGGLASALLIAVTPSAKWSGLAAAAAAVAVGGVRLAGADVFGHANSLKRGSANAVEVDRTQLGAAASGLRLSPSGTRFLVQRFDERGVQRGSAALTTRHTVGAIGGARRDFDAMHVEFLDDERLLALQPADDGLELRLELVDSAVTVWTAKLPQLYEPRLVVSPGDATWTVLGEEAAADSLFVMTGVAVSPDGIVHRFAALDSLGAMEQVVFDRGARLVVPVFDLRSTVPTSLAIFGMYTPRVSLWEVTAGTRRRIGELDGYPQCGQPEAGRAVCYVRQRNQGRLWVLGPGSAIRPLGRIGSATAGVTTFGPGAHLTVTHYDNHVTDVDIAAATATDIRLPEAAGTPLEARMANGQLVTLRNDAGVVWLVRYRVP